MHDVTPTKPDLGLPRPDGLDPGATWQPCKAGSRSGNRTVIRFGRGPRNGGTGTGQGIYYRDRRGTQWCTVDAWKNWARQHDARFSRAIDQVG